MTNPITNRGTAFTRAERLEHGMIGRLPAAVETLEQQAQLLPPAPGIRPQH